MASSSLAGKVQIYYILDPTPPSGEDIMNEEDETPLLLVTNSDISPTTGSLVKPTVSFLALASIAIFALGSFSFNEDLMNQLSDTEGFGGLYELSMPLALAVLSTQLAHEAGHLVFALKDGVSTIEQQSRIICCWTFHLNSHLCVLSISDRNWPPNTGPWYSIWSYWQHYAYHLLPKEYKSVV